MEIRWKVLILTFAILLPLITEVKSNPPGVAHKIVPDPIRHFFARETQKNVSVNDQQPESSDGRGKLEVFGHEVVKRIGKAFTSIGNKLGISKTKGLDVNKHFFNGLAANFKEHIRVIYPGTLWCGDGDVAKSKNDLGYFYLTDQCCRKHDSCTDYIPAGETRSGLENAGLFTRSNCECDHKFHNCLKQANTVLSNKIGFTYFTILGPQCFKIDYPIISCRATNWKRCVEYQVDTTKEPKLQWFDNPIY